MKVLLCHNFYQQESGENIAFRAESAILRRFGDTVIEYTKDSSHIHRDRASSVFLNGFFRHRTVEEISQIVLHERPDAALVHNVFPLISPSLYSALLFNKIPIVQVVYNYRFICPNGHLFTHGQVCTRCVPGTMIHAVIRQCFRKSRVQSAWYASILSMHRNLFRRSIAAYIIPDEFMRKVLAQGGFPAQRMFVNSTPFDVNSINASDTFEDYVLFVGRLVPQKGITTLIRAISLVQSPIRVIIVGEGEKRAEIETLASKANGRIEIKGPLYGERMHSLMERALAVIIPSEWYDNAPLALYHAFAHAKPVIASNIHGLKEIVRDGEDGFLFQPGSAAELAKTIDFLVNNRTLAAAMGRRARLKAEMEWDAPMHYLRLRAVLEFCKRH